MNIGDFVTEKNSDKVGLIIRPYNGQSFDWEVVFLASSDTGCYQDCCKESQLVIYNWKSYPKTIKEKFKLLLGIK